MTLPQALLIAIRAAGRALLNYAAHRIEHMAATAIARPLNNRDWDAEMMALVAAEQNRDDA